MRFIKVPLASLALAGMAVQASVAIAAPSVKEACNADIKQTCAAQYAARDRAKVKVCLLANKDKLSAGCRAAIDAQQAAKKE